MPGICDKWDTERIVEDIDVSQSDSQTMLDELTDAKNSLVQHNGYMPRQWVFGLIPRVPGHVFEENSDLHHLDPVGRFRRIAEMRHKCRMAAIETGTNAKIRKEFDWTIKTHARELRAWRFCVLLAGRKRCASSTRSVAGTSSGH